METMRPGKRGGEKRKNTARARGTITGEEHKTASRGGKGRKRKYSSSPYDADMRESLGSRSKGLGRRQYIET